MGEFLEGTDEVTVGQLTKTPETLFQSTVAIIMITRVLFSVVVFLVLANGIHAMNTTRTQNTFVARNITSALKNYSFKNIRNFLTNRAFVTRQMNCVLGKGSCDKLGAQIKKAIPEVVNNNCTRCTSTQAANARKLINYIQHNFPSAYADVLAKYRTNSAANITAQNQRNEQPPQIVPSTSPAKSTTPRVRLKSGQNSTSSIVKNV